MSENMTKSTLRLDIEKSHAEFGHTDKRGRQIGVDVSTWTVTMELLPEDYRGIYSSLAPGHYFVLRTQATRNGVAYGATQSPRYFKTEEEREIALGKYLRTTELRLQKLGVYRD